MLEELKDDSNILKNLPNEYSILVITDTHFGKYGKNDSEQREDKKFFEALDKLNEIPKFCICLGDTTEHGLKDEFKDYKRTITDKLLEKYNIKTFNTIGNHDLYNSGWGNYNEILYPYTSFYTFKTPNLSWYFLDSASGSLGNNQFSKLEKKMKSDSNSKIVLMHIPLYADGLFYFTMQNAVERNKIISFFNKNNVIATICGHTHCQSRCKLGNFTEYTIGGYLEKKTFAIITINELEKKISCSTILYD